MPWEGTADTLTWPVPAPAGGAVWVPSGCTRWCPPAGPISVLCYKTRVLKIEFLADSSPKNLFLSSVSQQPRWVEASLGSPSKTLPGRCSRLQRALPKHVSFFFSSSLPGCAGFSRCATQSWVTALTWVVRRDLTHLVHAVAMGINKNLHLCHGEFHLNAARLPLEAEQAQVGGSQARCLAAPAVAYF